MDWLKFKDEQMLIMEHPELQDLDDSLRCSLFEAYVNLLIKKKVVSANGIIDPRRYGCYNYISDIMSFLTKEEMLLLKSNPNQFAFKFMFSASFRKGESSFAYWLQTEGILAERTFEPIEPSFDRDRVFEEFTEVTGRSPFERFEKNGSAEFFKEYVVNNDAGLNFREDDDEY